MPRRHPGKGRRGEGLSAALQGEELGLVSWSTVSSTRKNTVSMKPLNTISWRGWPSSSDLGGKSVGRRCGGNVVSSIAIVETSAAVGQLSGSSWSRPSRSWPGRAHMDTALNTRDRVMEGFSCGRSVSCMPQGIFTRPGFRLTETKTHFLWEEISPRAMGPRILLGSPPPRETAFPGPADKKSSVILASGWSKASGSNSSRTSHGRLHWERLSVMAWRNSRKPGTPPESSGGQAPPPSTQKRFPHSSSSSMPIFSTFTRCVQLSPRS